MHMRNMLIILAVIVAAILVGAGLYFYGPDTLRQTPGAGEATAIGADPSVDVPFTVLAQGEDSQVGERKNYAAYTEEDFARLWTLAYGEEGAPAMPAVDFEQEYVIGVFAGQKPSGGHDITVERVTDGNTLRTVAIRLVRPGAGCLTTQALTSPFEIIAVPLSDRELARIDKDVEGSCQ